MVTNNDNIQNGVNEEITDFEENTKFTGEKPKRKSNKTIVALSMVLVGFFLVVILINVGRSYYESYSKQREAEKLEEKKQSQITMEKKGMDLNEQLSSVKTELPIEEVTPPVPLTPPVTTVNTPPPPKVLVPMMASENKNSRGSDVGDPKNQIPNSIQDMAILQRAEAKLVTATLQANAIELGDRSFVLPRGAFVPCILQTQLVSTVPGQTSCIVPNDIYSDDGTRLLIPNGSQVIGSYANTLKNGESRLAVLWERLKTSDGIVIDIASNATDAVGTMGVNGVIDNHWDQRIGAAFLLSVFDDLVDYAIARQGNTNNGEASTRSSKDLAQQVLETTINIQPTLTLNRGTRLNIFVQKDLWFDEVYGVKK